MTAGQGKITARLSLTKMILSSHFWAKYIKLYCCTVIIDNHITVAGSSGNIKKK